MAPPSLLLHGTIDATISNVENAKVTSEVLQGAEELAGAGNKRIYVCLALGLDGGHLGRTSDVIQDKSTTPWKETIHVYCAHTTAKLVFSVMTQTDRLVGRAYLPVQELLAKPDHKIERWFHVLGKRRQEIKGQPQLWMSIEFKDAADGLPHTRLPRAFYPQRTGSRVTLYQDAHAPDSFAPQIQLSGGGNYEPARCWDDVFDAISNARHLVYITGWSVYTEVTLVRDGTRPRSTLGELLKRKADEGVRVLVMVWKDPTSVRFIREGMKTHDRETERYFQGTSVHCIRLKRYKVGMVENILYSHHQKTITVDQQMRGAPGWWNLSKRHIISFVGGIDLCDGRYDTPHHSLFRTLAVEHRDDFHQPSLKGAAVAKGGPRQPWHDIHAKLEGPAAWDVLDNFEQRWKNHNQGSDEGLLVDLAALEFTRAAMVLPGDWNVQVPPGDWNVQVFRSIDSTSVVGFPESLQERFETGLVPAGKHLVTERSIQDAYIHAIRRAKNFIYIENQYFIGSSFQWEAGSVKPKETGAQNLIPRELSLKIASKIEAGERFSVYIVLPMWPEGLPNDDIVQEILYWQRKTMEMMYDDVAAALAKMNKMDADPRDYLTFFCLGNREVKKSGEDEPEERPTEGTDYARAQEARRFMIYVHSKMMIVDDEYIIVGSANINQRSLDGGRDTEIAMGAFQPDNLITDNQPARGQVHGFRMSLWYEHLGMLHDDFLQPESLGCIGKVNKMAEDNWKMYAQDDMLDKDLPGHLLAYPVKVTDGAVIDLTEYFPDTQAPVRGKKAWYTVGPFSPVRMVVRKAILSLEYDVSESELLPDPVLELSSELTYEEHPVRILDESERRTRSRVTKFYKVQWDKHTEDEATWERDDLLRTEYPYLFSEQQESRGRDSS